MVDEFGERARAAAILIYFSHQRSVNV
jgi:hypothetical protein